MVIRETPVLQGLTSELLAKHNTLIFWAIVNNPDLNRMAVIKQTESFQQLLSSQEFAEVFAHLGLTNISRLPMNGIDIPRLYEMLENLQDSGLTKITDLQDVEVEVSLIEEVVGKALLLPTSPYPVRERRTHMTLADLFENPKKMGSTYSQIKSLVLADWVRVVQHMFKLPKQ
ncbi:hypothetical protein L7F22_033863 [Adiantum nelumboides]|nr:hypothetical protein [Adiantum nelumboides]